VHSRFYLQPDPIGLDGGPNLYVYAGANPVGLVDPLGLDFKNTGNREVWVLINNIWRSVSPGVTLVGDTDAAVSVPEQTDCEGKKKCRAYKWVDCYDAEGAGFPSGSLLVKLTFCGWNNIRDKSFGRKLVCSNPGSAAAAQAALGGWVDPFAEFRGNAPPGCER